MQLPINEHQCPVCCRCYLSLDINEYGTYTKLCHECLENKVSLLESKVDKLYSFFDTVTELKMRS